MSYSPTFSISDVRLHFLVFWEYKRRNFFIGLKDEIRENIVEHFYIYILLQNIFLYRVFPESPVSFKRVKKKIKILKRHKTFVYQGIFCTGSSFTLFFKNNEKKKHISLTRFFNTLTVTWITTETFFGPSTLLCIIL